MYPHLFTQWYTLTCLRSDIYTQLRRSFRLTPLIHPERTPAEKEYETLAARPGTILRILRPNVGGLARLALLVSHTPRRHGQWPR